MEITTLPNTNVDTSPLVEAGDIPEIKYECKYLNLLL